MKPPWWFRQLGYGWHRARHGWAAPDWWELNIYLATILSEMLAEMAKKGRGYPGAGFPGDPSPERWNELGRAAEADFRRASEDDDYIPATGLRFLKTYWLYLWD